MKQNVVLPAAKWMATLLKGREQNPWEIVFRTNYLVIFANNPKVFSPYIDQSILKLQF